MKRRSISPTSALNQALRWLDPIYPGRRLGLAAAGILLLVGWLGLPATGILLFIGLVLLVYFAVWLYNALHFVDAQIAATVGEPRGWPVHRKVYPLYKFVDIYRAAQLFAGQRRAAFGAPIRARNDPARSAAHGEPAPEHADLGSAQDRL